MRDEIRAMLDEGRALDVQARKALVGHVLGECESELTTRDIEELADFLMCDDLRDNNKRHDDRPVYDDAQLAEKERRLRAGVDPADVSSEETTKGTHLSTDERIALALQTHRGESLRIIARAAGVSYEWVRRYLRKERSRDAS